MCGTGDSALARTYLITGVTGFLGKLVLEAVVRRRTELPFDRIFVLVRPRGRVSAARRFGRVVAHSPCLAHLPSGWSERVEVLEGDLSLEGCGVEPATARALRRQVTHVIHCAASVEFDLPLAEAFASNVTAGLELLELARGCERLESFVGVSTAYVTPHPGDGVPIGEELAPLPHPAPDLHEAIRSGLAHERELLERSGHPNTYTFTKSLCEHLLLQRRDGVPVSIVRPSIISASWRTPFPGWIDSAAAFAAFVAMIGSGHLRAVVGDPLTRLNLVPADWVAEQVVDASTGDGVGIRNAVAAPSHTPRLAECRDSIVRFFRSNPVDRRATLRYLGPPGVRFRLADGLHNRAPVRLAMLRSARQRTRGRRVLSRIDELNRLFPYFTRRSFTFESGAPFEPPDFDCRDYLSVVCEGVARHLLRAPVAPPRASRPGPPRPLAGGVHSAGRTP